MLTALILMLMLQDGPIRTAPESTEVPVPVAPPAPDNGRVVWNQSPLEPARIRRNSIEDCRSGWTRPQGQSEADCAARFQREDEAGSDANPRAAAARAGAEAGATPGEGRYHRLRDAVAATGHVVAPPESGVPAWALTDPARWEASQCGTNGDDACRRRARNALAMARAGVAAEPPAAREATTPAPQACRTAFRRAAEGVGGSMTRVCGDGADAEAALDRLESILPARPAAASCERPDSLETPEAWAARCRSLPPR